jgi:hypothetical protein
MNKKLIIPMMTFNISQATNVQKYFLESFFDIFLNTTTWLSSGSLGLSRKFLLSDPNCSSIPSSKYCHSLSGIIKTSFFGITGAKEDRSNICILGQNILNQKIYFVLWLWFMILFGVSVLVIINRIMCIFVPAFQRQVVASHLKSKNANRLTSLERIPLGHDYLGKWFLLAQLGRNSSPYKYRNFLDQIGEKQPLLDSCGVDKQA